MCAVLIYRHKSNIRKLVAGTESRIGGRKRSVES
jgi:glycerol-3-phosphate acyltransferase PlsY